MIIVRICFMCGRVKEIEVPDALEDAIMHYEMGNGYIQDIPAEPKVREFIKTGMCFDCQHLIFDVMEEEFEDEKESA